MGSAFTLATTHFTPQLISRSDGRSAVLSAAYRHCAKMEIEAEARIVDYSNKRNLAHEEFLLPADAPQWARDLIADRSVAGAVGAFWNRVEGFEKRIDAQLAKEFIIALPVELSRAENIVLVQQFVAQEVLARGQVADWAYHDEPGNPHIHLMTSLRPLTESGFGPKKVPVIGDDGKPLRTKSGKIQYRLWAGEKVEFLAQRQAWLDLQNRHLALAGLDIRVDGRSYAERGIEMVPTTHVGVAAKAIQRQADKRGREVNLERLEILERQRRENARRIERRPELVLEMITHEKSVFDERDIAKVLHRYIDNAATFNRLLARVRQLPDCLRLEAESIDLATGELLRSRFTTRELIRLEAEMVNRVSRMSRQAGFFVRETVLAEAFARNDRLSDEQRTAIEHVAAGGRIAAIVGRAGAGKTTMMKVAREVWEQAGYRVVGAALAGKAAEGLQQEAGIESRTLSSWELSWQAGREFLTQDSILVIDEAGMVASRQLAAFVDAASRVGAKLVLIGDPNQLQPIEAGAAFRAVVERIGYAELETIYRQKAGWMRVASLDLARGRIEEALTAYSRQGRVLGSDLKTEAISNLIEDWNRDYDPEKAVLILAHLRRDVRTLNDMARAKLVERGIIEAGNTFRTEDGDRRFAIGDQIVFLRNETSLGVKNGMIGRVVEAAPAHIVVEIGDGDRRRRVEIHQSVYQNIDHGYATTIHKSQGATVDRVKVLATLSLDRHLSYVAMTRHREDLKIYYGRRSFAINGGLSSVLGKPNAKETTLDYAGGRFYAAALRFANSRGLHLVRVARTLVSDRLNWTLRQKQRFDVLVARLGAIGARLGLGDLQQSQSATLSRKAIPMVAGVSVFSKSIEAAVEGKVIADPGVRKQWEEIKSRVQLIFIDPEAALRAMRIETTLRDPAAANATLDRLGTKPQSIGALRGKTGFLALGADQEKRRIATINIPALRTDIERFRRLRAEAAHRFESEVRTVRHRAAIEIPTISLPARSVLERVRDASNRHDLPAALELVLADRMVKLELDGLSKAVAERFGERALLSERAREPTGPVFETAASGLQPREREKLAIAWPILRATQQLAAHLRTNEALKEIEALRQAQRQGQVLK